MTAAVAQLSMYFRPTFEMIASAREFVTKFYDEILDDPDATSRVALTAQELLENATKYSTDGATTLEIDVCKEGAGHVLSVRTSNGASPEHLAELERRIQTMQRSGDPF